MKISIITAPCNSGTTLRDTINSVLSQNYTDFQHIIVDGGSKDNTLEIIKEYEPKYNGRLKWVSEKDNGLYDAMNKGIAMADGEIVGILNSDDFYSSSDILNSIAKNIEGYDAIYGDIHFVNGSDLDKVVRYFSSQNFSPWKMRFGFMPAHPSFYCRRDLYVKYGYYDLNFPIGADFEMLVRLILINNIRTKYLPLDFVTMRTGGVSTSGIRSHNQISKDIVRALRQNGIKSNIFIVSLRYIVKTIELLKTKLTQ